MEKNKISDVISKIATVVVSATTEKFVAKDNFKTIFSAGGRAEIRISFISHNFEEWFLAKVEDPFPGSTVYGYKLNKSLADTLTALEFYGKEKEKVVETTLVELFSVMKRQADGRTGALLINGRANTFYVRDINNVLRVVKILWYDGGWYLRSFSLNYDEGRVGNQVFCSSEAA